MRKFAYFPHTEEQIKEMLQVVGVEKLDDLYSDLPSKFMFQGEFDLPSAKSEEEIREYFGELSEKNTPLKVFTGMGAYDHYAPSVISYLTSRSEFETAYTPYQAEISQGTLRYIFEYQSLICSLTGMDVSNASMYDGSTAAAEAIMMAVASVRKKNKVLVSATLLPHVRKVVQTYALYQGIELETLEIEDGQTSYAALEKALQTGDVAGVLVPQINRYGIIEDHSGFAELIHGHKGLLIEYSDPSALSVLKSPAEVGADIVVGEAQSLGIPLSYGGPYLGFMACTQKHMRKLPGRIVGETKDADGRRCFVLTLQAREQHIKRQRATSNICSNQSLMTLYVTIYMSLMGQEGLKKVNDISYAGAHYLYEKLLDTGKFEPVFDRPFLKEFVLKSKLPAEELMKKLEEKGFFAAYPTEEGYVSFCVTERRTKKEVDSLIAAVESLN